MTEEENEFIGFEEPETAKSDPDTKEEETEEVEETEETESDDTRAVAGLPLDVIEEAIGYGLLSSDIERLGSEENIANVLAILDRQIDDDPFADPDENTGSQNSEVAELRKQVQALQASIEGKSVGEGSDRLFGLLGSDYDDLFGEVGEETTSTQNRNKGKVLQELETLKAGYKARKRAIPSDRRLFKKAVSSVFGGHESKVVKKKFSDSANKRKSQFISRVNSKDNSRRPQNTRESAIDSVKKFLSDRGYTDLESVETFE